MPLSPRDAEEAAQRDPMERARRLARFKARTQNREWRYNELTGQWSLVDILDGTKPIPTDPYSFSQVA